MTEYNEINEIKFENQEKQPRKRNSMVKKAGAIALSAVLFGGVAAGTFQAVNYAVGYSTQEESISGTASEAQKNSLLKATSFTGSESSSTGSLDVSSIAEGVMPSIVSITNKSVQEVQNYFDMFGYRGQTQTQEMESSGSGIIIGKNDTELLIITNYHVIESANTLSASFIDNQTYEATVKGTNQENDLAVIAIPLDSISEETMSEIAVAEMGDSEALKVGEQVVAIGNALGYGQSVTTGIVSATNRTIGVESEADGESASTNSEDVSTYIQTDAAINPGNSGGALVNMDGQVIGINSAKLASTEIEGMGYAIPITKVSDIIENLMNETTRIQVSDDEKSTIGISGTTVNDAINQTYGIPIGVYVSEVTAGSGAEAAGIGQGDVITKFDGKEITGIEQLGERLVYYKAGETVEVTIQEQENNAYSEKTVSLTLGKADISGESEADLYQEDESQDGFAAAHRSLFEQ